MNVVDSCGWLEFFAGGSNKEFFRAPLQDTTRLIVPSMVVFEVCRRTLVLADDATARRVFEFMQQGQIVTLDEENMFQAALNAAKHKLAMADAIIWQTARVHQAKLYTQDVDLRGLPSVQFKAKQLLK